MTTPQVSPKTVPDDLDVETSPRTSRIDSADHTVKQMRRDKLAYDLKIKTDLRRFLEEHHGLTNFDVDYLSGGTANYVYRVTERGSGVTRIFKHAARQLRSSKETFELSPERLDFEADMLMMLMKRSEDESECHCRTVEAFDASTIEKTHVHTARFKSYDRDIKLLCIEDGGDRNLKDAYKDLSLAEVQEIGAELGKWLAKLHGTTPLSYVSGDDEKRNNSVGVAIASYTYKRLLGTLDHYCDNLETENLSNETLAEHMKPYDDTRRRAERLSKRAGDLVDNRMTKMRESVCHGDFWPGNIMLRSNISTKGPSHGLTVLDWELTRIGNSATDIGQFAAEATILDLLNGNSYQSGLCAAFIRAYFKASAVGIGSKETIYAWMTQIAIHYAVHLIVWPPNAIHWAPKEEAPNFCIHGLTVLKDALSQMPDIRTWGLFAGLDGLEEIAKEFPDKRGKNADE